MKYNTQTHHGRSIRLKGYDYSRAGAYFITICCQDRECRFGKIVVGASLADAQMELNEYGTIAYDEWNKLPKRFPNFELDVFQIMPNHMHGIIVLNDPVIGATLAVAPDVVEYHGILQNDDVAIQGAGASPALRQIQQTQRLATLWVHTNHWWQMHVWKYLNQKMK